MLHIEVSRLWSKGLISVFTESKASYDVESNSVTKLGKTLKKGDFILRRVDAEGRRANEDHSWEVTHVKFTESLTVDKLVLGGNYGIYVRNIQAIVPFRLVGINLDSQTYDFRSLEEGVADISAVGLLMATVDYQALCMCMDCLPVFGI